jgi:predicted phosphohydrolase
MNYTIKEINTVNEQKKSIRIHLISDIHLEFYKTFPKLDKKIQLSEPGTNTINILCLCGDIGYPHMKIYAAFIDWIAPRFDKIFIIAGNHEYYSSTHTIDQINSKINSICEKYENISFLNRTTELYENILFVGTTLWSNISKTPATAFNEFNDFTQIRSTEDSILTPQEYYNMHLRDLKWLKETLDVATTTAHKEIILLTHNLPSYSAIHHSYRLSSINSLFASNLDYIMAENPNIRLWLFGHTHKAINIRIKGTLLLANPLGYPKENPHMSVWNKTITLDEVCCSVNPIKEIVADEEIVMM